MSINNGDFSTSNYWERSDANVEIFAGSAGYARMSNRSLGGARWIAQSVTVVSGQTYELKWDAMRYMRYDVWCAYEYTDTTGVRRHIDCPSLESKLVNQNQWYRLAQRISIPAGIYSVKIFIKSGANAADGASYTSIDNVAMDLVSGNLVNNGDFENSGLTGWGWFSDQGLLQLMSGGAYRGSYCVKSSQNNGNMYHMLYQEVNLSPGKTYTVSHMFKAIGPNARSVAGFQWFNSSGVNNQTYCPLVYGNDSWKKVSHTLTLPSTASPIAFVCCIIETGDTPYSTTGGLIDYVQLYEGTSTPGGGDESGAGFDPDIDYLRVKGDGVNVRSDAGTGYGSLYSLNSGTVVKKIGEKNDTTGTKWYKIQPSITVVTN